MDEKQHSGVPMRRCYAVATVNICLDNRNRIINEYLLEHKMRIFGTLSMQRWCKNCVVTSRKFKTVTNYGHSVLDCFVSIACDCDVTAVGPLGERGWPISVVHGITTAIQLNGISWSEINLVQRNSVWIWFNFWSRFNLDLGRNRDHEQRWCKVP